MKKSLIILVVVILLAGVVLSAQSSGDNNKNKKTANLPKLKNNLTDKLKNKTEDALEKEITAPYFSLFHFKNNRLTLKEFIIFICIFFISFLFIQEASIFVPSAEKRLFGITLRTLMAIILTLISAVTGIMRIMTLHFISLGNSFKTLAKYGFLEIILILSILIILILIFFKIKKYLKEQKALDKAKKMGERFKQADIVNKIKLIGSPFRKTD